MSVVHGWPVPKHRLARRIVSSRISTPEASALRERSLPYQLRSTRKLLTRRKVADRSTLKAQDLTRLNPDIIGEIREMHPLLTTKLNNITLRHAVKDYLSSYVKDKRFIILKYGEIGDWDVSNVTNMDDLFPYMSKGAESFNQPLNNWNVSKVTDMMLMFTRARSFNRPLNNWNVSKVETMFAMFDDATSLNQPLHAPWYHEESEDKSDTDSDSE